MSSTGLKFPPRTARLSAPHHCCNTNVNILSEGKYHQVKRMVAAISNRVERLHRIQIGDLTLPEDLKVGQWRWLSERDMIKLENKS